MTYGHRLVASIKSAVTQRALDRASGSWGGYQAWRQLDSDERLQLVEQALATAANDVIDNYPLAL